MLIKEVLKELDIQEFNDNADLGMNPEEFFKVTSLGVDQTKALCHTEKGNLMRMKILFSSFMKNYLLIC